MNSPRSAMALVLAAAALSCAAGTSRVSADNAGPSLVIQMRELNGSGENGVATLTPVGDKVQVSVNIAGEPKSASQPAHVHFGRCPIIRAIPAYNVGPIVGGKASQVVDLPWNQITSGAYVLNVHESAATLGHYVSCGNIGGPATPAPLPTEDSGY